MYKLIILLIVTISATNGYGQSYRDSGYYSIIDKYPVKANEWLIALDIEQAGRTPIFDSLGRQVSTDPTGMYMLTYIDNQYMLRKLKPGYIDDKPVWSVAKRVTLSGGGRYTTDSIIKTANEWIYANIGRDDSLNTYYVQDNGNHSQCFHIFFRAANFSRDFSFGEIDISNPARYTRFIKPNLNEAYNKSTFIYRALVYIAELVKKEMEINIRLD